MKSLSVSGILLFASTTLFALTDATTNTNEPASQSPVNAQTSNATSTQSQPENANPNDTMAIDCTYKATADKPLSESITKKWAENAAIKSFDMNYENLEAQLSELKKCYTTNGWESFNDALKKSGNLDAIDKQKLSVKSKAMGIVSLTKVKSNEIKATVPLEVSYHNSQESLTQHLSVELLINKNQDGSLGIMQLIAAPAHTKNANPSSASDASSTHD